MDDLARRVTEILAQQALVDPSSLRLEDDPAAIGLDSLGMVEAIFVIEEEFGISVPFNANTPDQTDFDISSVASVVAGVRRLVSAKG
ncbi:phosphopantetheine-binding protein [Xinfangfangia sp. CPCC 101601]|uniref:Phosphopantetheine-binding protein n=1 Tax=Pseudogemmobacter lacusdianii TaxID=3069608 RepID=A0ABU0VUY4_9RHOB|nr:phosphopantetheine-binding protein [Xinfangfangia sp. CPCC 101601]MDQ2065493.1 phosphopantetheine-binding protein [Xinfangfangia sp. CPCC 101601]